MNRVAARQPDSLPRLSLPADAFAHQSILASAGSGKTHALTTRYLQLVAAGAAPSTILASTFTRLAAAEIRDRVLERLSDAAIDAKKQAELSGELGLREPKAFTGEVAASLLAALVRQLHRLQLRTLDSFFSSIVRVSAIDLGLPVGIEVVDEEQETALRSEAIALMLDEHKPQDLVELLRQLTRGEAGRSVTEAIDAAVSEMYELWREAPAEAWDCVPELPGKLKRADVVAAIEQIEAVSPGTDGRFVKAHAADLARARSFDWEEFVTSGLASCIANGKANYYSKAIPPAVIAAYQPLVDHAKAEVMARLRGQTIASRDMLNWFHAQFEALKHRRGVVTFSDLVTWCERAMAQGSLETIAFRLDSAVQHLLLDEFQDTSIAQWRSLQPIVEEIVATAPPERSFFCVGDVKQSIYGWRGAAPEVLEELPGELPGVTVRTLAKSYRSAPEIINAVNQVFEGLPANPAVADHIDTAKAWLHGYEHHDTVHAKRAGYVDLRVVERIDDNGERGDKRQWEHRLKEAAKFVAKLARDWPDVTIAVLVRKNASVARMLVELGPPPGLDVRASGRGGGPVTDAPACNALLDLLRLADHPDDTVAAFNVAASPVGVHVGLREWGNEAARQRVAEKVRRDVLEQGVAMALAKLARHIAPECAAREIRRVYQLVELAGQFDAQPSLRMDDFIAMAEQKTVAETQPARVQVMTIHQAKGLDFDAVVLPDLDFKLPGHTSPKLLYEREGETGPIMRMCRYFSRELEPFVPELKPLKERSTRRTVRESLSLLYVAMTRPKYALHMFIDAPKANEKKLGCTAANVVRFALAPGGLAQPVAFAAGDPNWPAKMDKKDRDTESAPLRSPKAIRFAKSKRRAYERAPSPAALALHSPGGDFRGWEQRLDREARDRGTAAHRIMQQIEWLEEFELDDAALCEVVRASLPRREGKWIADRVNECRKALACSEIAVLLRRPAKGPFVVRHEVPFARMTSDGLQTGAIDRLVIEQQGGKPVRAEVIDFKTSVLTSESVDAEAARYRPQLEAYAVAAAEMLQIDLAHVAMKIVFLHVGRVVTL